MSSLVTGFGVFTINTDRLGVAGHSIGGGGSLMAARDNPSLGRERFGCIRFVALDSVLHEPRLIARQGVSDYRSTCPYQ